MTNMLVSSDIERPVDGVETATPRADVTESEASIEVEERSVAGQTEQQQRKV